MADKYTISARDKVKFSKDREGLSESTRIAYGKLAENFYKVRLGGETPSPKRIADALVGAAGDYRPGYFRKLRNALMYDQVGKGYFDAAQRLKETGNPVTTGKTRGTIKPKQKRIKSVPRDELMTLLEKSDKGVGSAIAIVSLTGCRPAEMLGIQDQGGDEIFIPGAKKSNGNRGLDRTLTLPADEKRLVMSCVADLRAIEPGVAGTMHKIQSRLDRLTKRLWPRRKARPTLYSWRHQLGADLKASGMDRVQIAYTMGHQSTESVEVYGDPRKASSKRGIKPAQGANMSMIRQKHDVSPGPKAPAIAGPSGPSL